MRIQSIDIFRGITMVLMIFVNDFWTLKGIPQWLRHMPTQADALGFSDVIFPGFLFIVGLSIPFAIDNRLKKENTIRVFYHILTRSIALILMGVYLVNLENIYPAAMSIPKQL
jgi:predicted acyltransferase